MAGGIAGTPTSTAEPGPPFPQGTHLGTHRGDLAPSLGRIGRRALLSAAIAVTVASLVLALGQMVIGIDAAREVMQREKQTRALTIATITGQMRQVGTTVRDTVARLSDVAGADRRRCGPALAADSQDLAPFLVVEPGAALPPTGVLACLLATIRDAQALTGGEVVQQIGYLGPGWYLAYPAPVPNRAILDALPDGVPVTAAVARAAAEEARGRTSFFDAPASLGFNGDGRVVNFAISGPGSSGAASSGAASSGTDAAGWSEGAFVAIMVDELWTQTFPLSGPANEVLLLRADGQVITRGRAAPGEEPAPLPAGIGMDAVRQGGDGMRLIGGAGVIGAVHLADPDWYLVSLVRPWDLLSWLVYRNALTLAVLAGATLLAWLAYAVIARRILAPAQALEALLAETLRDLQATFTNITEGLLVVDNNGRIVSGNPRVAQVLGVPPDLTVPGRPLLPLRAALYGGEGNLTRTDAELVAHLRSDRGQQTSRRVWTLDDQREVAQYQVSANSFEIALADGRWVEMRVSTHADGVILLYADITDRKRADLAARRAKEEAETARASAEQALIQLEEAQAQLVESGKMAALGELVAGVAHEVNTPVGVSVTAASSLAERLAEIGAALAAGRLTKEQLETFLDKGGRTAAILTENLDRAARLVRSFKQVAVDQHLDEAQDTNLKAYLDTALVSLRHELKRGQHRLVIAGSDDVVVSVVPAHLWQVTSNLVLNAVNHAFADRTEGTITITVGREGGMAVMTVADDGVGMPPDVLKRCFDPFFTTRRGTGGSGLGLSIVRNIVTSGMKGRVTAASTPGAGTVFTIAIPLTAFPQIAAGPAAPSPG
ncbi:MAG: hypothetical protein RLY86_3510 [Pseudomonadota bacterium]|jgi:signal transduction histidine kinase